MNQALATASAYKQAFENLEQRHLVYGEAGKGYIQVHHLKSLSNRDMPEETHLDELMLICANCHVIVHRESITLDPNFLIE